MATSEDDFWNESSLNKSNIFDEDDETCYSENDVLNLFGQENESAVLPIHSIISNNCLTIILDDIDSTVEPIFPSAEESVKKMFHENNCILNMYRSLEDKLTLLDSALDVGDGSVILSVILFLKKSLKSNVFLNQMLRRKIAIKHYANYLIEKNNLLELVDLYMATGNIFNLKDIYYLMTKDIANQDVLYKRLEQFEVHHAQNLYSVEDKTEIEENMKFLEFQIKHKCDSSSVIEQLIFLCKTEWQKGNGDEAIYQFKKQFKIDDFQYDWVVMSVLCKLEYWDKLLTTFTKTVWVIKKRALKSIIRPDLFMVAVGRYAPPINVIEQFLLCINDVSKSTYLAEKLKMHEYVVNHYIEQKDKMSLLKYMEKIEPGDSAIITVQSALSDPDIRWKN